MRIAIIGYSGSGKSTLCRFLGEKYGIPMLHFDTVQFLPNWEVREACEKEKIVREFLDENENWCIDGNYSKIFFAERMEKANGYIRTIELCQLSFAIRPYFEKHGL